jgi:hypothetical protein
LLEVFGEPAAPWISGILGCLIVLVALAGIIELHEAQAWISMGLGLGTLAVPWLLAIPSAAVAFWIQVVAGVAVALLAIIQLWVMRQDETRAEV